MVSLGRDRGPSTERPKRTSTSARERVVSEKRRAEVPDRLERKGGLGPGVSRQVAKATGVPEAEVYGVGSFFHLLADSKNKLRVCTGLSCRLAGADGVLETAKQAGMPVTECTCLAGCDVAPAVLRDRRVLPSVRPEDIRNANGNWEQVRSSKEPVDAPWHGYVGPEGSSPETRVLDLHGLRDYSGSAFNEAVGLGLDGMLQRLEASGLQGRGGAGFPAFIKWRTVAGQEETERYVVLNADEGEPGTFKDREVLLRRPDLVLEGLAIAAATVGAQDVFLYLRGEFEVPWGVVEEAIAEVEARDLYPGISFHMHAGQGAYICGEESALIEALEGKRGMPRLRPPFPAEKGLWNKPTLVHNVETIACVPSIMFRGAEWFRGLGREEPGTKLYCVSGHVQRPGTYELPLGVTLDELVEAARGYVGNLKAFSPGGASSGFLPASERTRPLSFRALAEAGSMLGSGGVVVLNDTVDIVWAVREQLRFFEEESCGQCAPCRIGTRYLRESVDQHYSGASESEPLAKVADAAWQMNEGSICGLGQAASLPLTTALKHFPEAFDAPDTLSPNGAES